MKTKNAITLATKVFTKMINNNESLSYKDIHEVIGEKNAAFIDTIINALKYVGKVLSKKGPGGGIVFNPRQGAQRSLTTSNLNDLENYFNNNLVDEDASPTVINSEIESQMYEPFVEYLNTYTTFEKVVNIAGNHFKDGKWENPDIIAIDINNNADYFVGIDAKLIVFELKITEPTIEDIMQATNYLRYFNSSYLVYYDNEYTGKDYNGMYWAMHNGALWGWLEKFKIGLIIAFRPTVRSEYSFQIIREAPYHNLSVDEMFYTISRYYDDDSVKMIKDRMKDSITRHL
jgi:hypothetical protein